MPEVSHTLSEFQALSVQDMIAFQKSALDKLKRLEAHGDQIRQEVARRNEVTLSGLSAQLGVEVPRKGIRFDGPDKDGCYLIAWEEAAKPKVHKGGKSEEPKATPSPKKKTAKKKTRKRTKAS